MIINRIAIFLGLTSLLWVFLPAAFALKLPAELKASLQKKLPVARFRIDGALEVNDGSLYLPLIPIHISKTSKPQTLLKAAFPNMTSPDCLFFENGWCFLKVLSVEKWRTFIPLNELPSELQQAVLSTRLASDLIVPDNFVLPSSMKSITGSVAVAVKDIVIKSGVEAPTKENKTEKSVTVPNSVTSATSGGWILVTSPATGKVSLFTYPELKKTIEFPMEGTPSGITYANGKVYIADQSKARVLKLDPYHKLFLGQIDLPKGSVPKDVVALPDGKLIYVSENMHSDVAVFETDTDRLLVRTKVHSYPGKMAISPDGTMLLILSVPDGRVSMLSPQTQRFIGTIPVGSLPNGIAINTSGKVAYISNRVSNTVSVLDLVHHNVILTLKTGIGPTGLAIDANNKRLYVANAKDNSISIFDLASNRKINDIKLPLDLDFPGSLTFLPDKKHILVSSESTEALGLFDTTSQSFEKIASVGHTSDQCLWIPGQ